MIGIEINVQYEPNEKQYKFHESNSDQVVYGGAKGGGKSCALVMEAFAYACEYPGANMYIFRETYDDLEANIIKEWKAKVPKELYSYHESKHNVTMYNETTLKFRYIRNYADAERYQGRSMDWVGVDELTKHEERSISELLSCLRSPKGFPPRFRATCNPGGIGHTWVKNKYITPTKYGKKKTVDEVTGDSIEFIPAKVQDNVILMENDPNYVKRLLALPEDKKKAFLYGDWDIFEGQFFKEYDRKVHVVDRFPIPRHWDKYQVIDYGLDMLAGLWIAVSTEGKAYVYKEVYKSDLIISEAAKRLIKVNARNSIKVKYGPPDLWGRRQESGKTAARIFSKNGWTMRKSNNKLEQGCMMVKEWLKVRVARNVKTGKFEKVSDIYIFDNCENLLRCLPEIQADEDNPNVYSKTPHELTHIIDALRYFCVMMVAPSAEKETKNTTDALPKALVKKDTKKQSVIIDKNTEDGFTW